MAKLSNAYALLIGVGDEELDTLIDAKAIYELLIDENLACYDANNIILVNGKNSTRKHILEAFDKLQEITNEDSSIFLYYSGHGGYGLDEYFIQPYGMVGTSPEEARNSWVSASELKEKLNGLKSKRLIFFLDCCHAAGMTKGGIFNNKNDVKNKSGIIIKSAEVADGLGQKIDNERGVSIISSCREDQLSYQQKGENSIFTKCLINVIKGKHKSHFEEPFIRIYEVSGYLQKEVPKIALEIAGKEQNPYVNLQLYDNFTLSYVPKEIREKLSIKNIENKEKVTSKKLKEVVTSYRETKESNNLLLFVHGFSGEAADTFGIIPDLLMKDERMNGWDMKPLGYSPNVDPEFGKDIWGGIEDIDKISNYLVTSFKYKFDKYDRIAIVAHSLGGLIAQKAIISLTEDLRSKISHLILLGTPNNGISSELLSNLYNEKYQQLSSTGDFIVSLRKEWETIFKNKYPFKLKVAAAIDDEYVNRESNFKSFPENYCETIAGNHLSMVKPLDEFNDCYFLILNTLTNNNFHNKYTNKEEINIALGKYDRVVKKLLPIVNSLDLNGLKQLAFSLEGSDRKKEALEILTNHPLSKNNGDLFGMIAGRYKRSYLLNYLNEEGENAFEYYMKGLELGIKDENLNQIYYQAINLAFLSLVVYKNESDMTKYAKQALEAANACRDNLWKFATMAEANLYLNNLNIAKEFYLKAAEISGIREKISIHTNAFKAYCSLMNTDNLENEFIKFLHANFLV